MPQIKSQQGALPAIVMIVIALAAAAAGSGAVWYVKDQQLHNQKQDADRKITDLTRELRLAKATPSPSPSVSLNPASAQSAQLIVKQFLLAVANPNQPNVTALQRKAGLPYLSGKLQAAVNQKYSGDPLPLLGIAKPVPFDVPAPVSVGGGLLDEQVVFKNGDKSQTVSIGLQPQASGWVINRIVSFTGE